MGLNNLKAKLLRRDLEERVAALESDFGELRKHQLRLAELTDVVQELLIPMATRDQERIDAAIEKFQEGNG